MAPAPPCARCGRDAMFDFDELWLCLDCYHVAGSTCAGVNRPAAAPAPASAPRAESTAGSTTASADAVC